jgi:hypothetical protein
MKLGQEVSDLFLNRELIRTVTEGEEESYELAGTGWALFQGTKHFRREGIQ